MKFPCALFVTLSTSILLVACDANFLKSKEELCLNSERISFKDPTSLKLIANIGQRGFQASKDDAASFWIRYIAKNEYGANVAGNMACKKSEKGWMRDRELELSAIGKVEMHKTKEILAKVLEYGRAAKACKDLECKQTLKELFPQDWNNIANMKDEVEKSARAVVLESADDIN